MIMREGLFELIFEHQLLKDKPHLLYGHPFNSLRPSDAYMRRWTYHHRFK